MVVWFSSGQRPAGLSRPVLRFAWPVLLAVAVLALLVWPWTNSQIRELRDRYQGRGDIERVAPGRFIESAGGQRVFFIDKDSADAQTGSNIFIAARERGKEAVMVRPERPPGGGGMPSASWCWTRATAWKPRSPPATDAGERVRRVRQPHQQPAHRPDRSTIRRP
jgi:hypothetical protein